MTKPIDQAAHSAVEHRERLRAHFMRDGQICQEERGLIHGAHGVYLRVEVAAKHNRLGVRVLNGGAVDNELMSHVNYLRDLAQAHRDGFDGEKYESGQDDSTSTAA